MRIIAGVAKGRALAGVAHATRPTSDRAREALFSTLVSEFGDFQGIKFLDLYAGTGAVGLEALSRGAALVHAVEKDPSASQIIASNYELVKSSEPVGSFHCYAMSVQNFLTQGVTSEKYHIVYLDPPYDFDGIENILENLKSHLDPIALIAVERDSKREPFVWPAGYVAARKKNYGQATIYYAGVAT